MNDRGSEVLRLARLLLGEVEWNILAIFPEWLWKTFGSRVIAPTERAGYNLDPVKVPFPRVRKKARKDIGKYSNYLEKNDENRLIHRDIWIRLLRALNDLLEFDRRQRELEGRHITAIIAVGLQNACAIFHLMNEYAKGATTRNGDIHRIQLACNGMLQVATFDREAVTWHFGLKVVVLLALDIGSLARAAPLGTRLRLKHMSDLQWYLGKRIYDPVEDVYLLECSCNEDVVQQYLYAWNTLALGQQVGR